MKVLFLASGGGGNFRFIYHANEALNLNFEMLGIISDRICRAHEFACTHNLYSKAIKYSRSNVEELNEELQRLKPDIVITTIHKILAESTLSAVPECKFINLHYSLLPSFKGTINMQPVDQGKSLNAQFIGTSVHEVIEEVDAGRLISQSIFHPDWNSDINIIYDTVFKSGCLALLNALLKTKENSNSYYPAKSFLLNNYEVTFSEALFNMNEKILNILTTL